jgi:arylsulfatase A-like enzyme
LRSERRSNCERDEAILGALGEWLARGKGQAFAYVHLMSPHIPYDPPPEIDPYRGDRLLSNAEQIALLQRTDALEGERGERLQGLYDATVGHADGIVARFLELLRQRGMYDQSIIVITADHGEEFHEHGRWGHGKSLYDELVRVPLVMRGPGIGAGRAVEEPVMLVDVMPTLAKLVGFGGRDTWEGVSVDALVIERMAYAELIREGGLESYMAYRGGRKYIETTPALGQAAVPELYDLKSDPGETKNLIMRGGEEPTLAAALAAMREQAGAKRVAGAQEVDLDEGAQERLKALGYVN